jgi:Protein of unknown function (DUF2568)
VGVSEDQANGQLQAAGPGRGAFLAFRFGMELVTLAVLAWAGASASAGLAVRIILAIGGPVLLMVIWGAVMAPTARRRLRDPARLGAELAIFLASAVALAAAGHVVPAVIYAVIAVAAASLSRVIAPDA